MKSLIQSYLSRYYEIDTSEVGNDGIYLKAWVERPRPPRYSDRLLDELYIIFSIPEKTIKVYVNKWAKSVRSDVDLVFYWSVEASVIASVVGRTIATELVSVQPMPAPTTLGYDYSGITEEKSVSSKPRRLDRETIHEKWGDVIKQIMKNEDDFFRPRLRGPYE